jgi:hypothetical protein
MPLLRQRYVMLERMLPGLGMQWWERGPKVVGGAGSSGTGTAQELLRCVCFNQQQSLTGLVDKVVRFCAACSCCYRCWLQQATLARRQHS